MLLYSLFENHSKEILCIYAGRFQPWHKGHAMVFKQAQNKFGEKNCFIATSNTQDSIHSPFSFDEKKIMITTTGIPVDRVILTKSPYRAKEIYENYDPNSTVLMYVVGKDINRFNFEKDKFKLLPDNINDALPFSEQKYIYMVPKTFKFDVLGRTFKSATEIREFYKNLTEEQSKKFIHDMYGEFSHKIQVILDTKLSRSPRTIKEVRVLQHKIKKLIESDIWGHTVYPGNKGVLVKTYRKLNDIRELLSALDHNKPLDPEVVNIIRKQVINIIQQLKGN